MIRHSSVPRHSSPARGRAALLLLSAAAVVWSVVLWREHRAAPLHRHITAAVEYTRRGQAARAEREWRAALRIDPQNAALWEQLAELYFSTSNWPAATGAFRRVLSLQPDIPRLYSRLAASALRAGDEVGAYRYAQEELRRDPDSVSALAIAALLYAHTGEEQQRLNCLRRLTRLRPDDEDFLTMLAEALTDQHLYAEARPVLVRLLGLNPASAEAYAWRAVGWLHEDPSPQGLARAEADLYRSLRLNPLAPFPRLYLGKLYRSKGQPGRALFQLEHAARLTPEKRDILFELAEAYAAAGRSEEAAVARARFARLRRDEDRARLLEQRCAAFPDNFAYHRERGLLALVSGDARKADFFLRRAQALRPNDARVRAALRQLAEEQRVPPQEGEPGAADARAQRRLLATLPTGALAPQTGGADRPAAWHYQNGLRLLQSGSGAGATVAWETAIALDPSFPPPYVALATQREASGDFVGAAGVFEALRRADSEAPHVECRRAELYVKAGRFEQVLPIAREAVRREPECALAHRMRGALLLGAEDRVGATLSLRRACSLASASTSDLLATAPLLAQAGCAEEAIRLVTPLLHASCDPVPVNALLGQLLVLYRRRDAGERVAARLHLERALAAEPDHPVANAAMGMLLASSGRHSIARPYLERARRQGILDPEGMAMLAEVYARLGLPEARAVAQTANRLHSYRIALRRARRRHLTRPGPESALTLAMLEAERGDVADAAELVKGVLRANPDDPKALALLSRLTTPTVPVARGTGTAQRTGSGTFSSPRPSNRERASG